MNELVVLGETQWAYLVIIRKPWGWIFHFTDLETQAREGQRLLGGQLWNCWQSLCSFLQMGLNIADYSVDVVTLRAPFYNSMRMTDLFFLKHF